LGFVGHGSGYDARSAGAFLRSIVCGL
jgi:hypothetical protein